MTSDDYTDDLIAAFYGLRQTLKSEIKAEILKELRDDKIREELNEVPLPKSKPKIDINPPNNAAEFQQLFMGLFKDAIAKGMKKDGHK